MKRIVLTSLALAGLVFTGCSKKNPEVDMSSNISSINNNANHSYNDMSSHTDMLGSLMSGIQNQVKNVYFDFDKFNIKADQQAIVSSNAALFNQHGASTLSIKVEGNCDEWGTDEYNYALGLKRAKSVKDSLIKNGVSADRIAVVSYGESNPVCTSKTKSCDADNRRVEFKVLQ